MNLLPEPIYQAQVSESQELYNAIPKQKMFTTQLKSAISCARWSPTYGKYLMVASMDSSLSFWDVFGSGQCIASLNLHSNQAVTDCQWNHDGSKFISGGFDQTVQISDFITGRTLRSLSHEAEISCLKFHPVETNLFIACQNEHNIWTWDIRSNEMIREFKNKYGRIISADFINDGDQLVTSTVISRKRNIIDKGLIVRDFKTTEDISNQVSNDLFEFYQVNTHPSGDYFLAQNLSGSISTYASKMPYKRHKKKVFETHPLEGYPVKFDISPDGSMVISGSASGHMHFYNWKSSREIVKIKAHKSPCIYVAYHPVIPTAMVTGSWDGEMIVWN